MKSKPKAGWRPGAISKRLLKQLNKAKNQHPKTNLSEPAKKSKKQVDKKPTLIISKRNGEMIVEMKVEGEKAPCNPLVYKIANADNIAKVKARDRKQRRLVRNAVGHVWTDPYNPDACYSTCYKVYKQAIGLDPFDPYDPECMCPDEFSGDLDSCSCSDKDIDSQCSSLGADWEIHFTPPNATHRSKFGLCTT